MGFVDEDTVRLLREIGTEPLPIYERALTTACTAGSPPFGEAWYGERYRHYASDPTWLAMSLLANAEKEAEGSRKLWDLVARTPSVAVAEAIRLHAIDESRHALLYIAMCDLVFPGALEGEIRTYADSLSPRYSSRDRPQSAAELSSDTAVVDELIQMNIGEIRTRIHQLLMRPIITAHCPSEHHERLFRTLDSLITDESKHVQYTARLIDAADVEPNFVVETMSARVAEFNVITLAEVGEARFVGE